jgi:hypothetical protein
MDRVRFVLAATLFPAGERLAVDPYVNDIPLAELARKAQEPLAAAAGESVGAADHAGLRADLGVRWPSRHYLGEPVLIWFAERDTILLGCVCGDPGCCPLTAEVTVLADTVVWDRFRTGHRDWDLAGSGHGGLGPFRFDRAEYTAELRSTAEAGQAGPEA